MIKAPKPRKHLSRIASALALSALLGPPSTPAQETLQPAQQPLEYDYCGSLVPATLPHMYRYAFRLLYKPKKDIPMYAESARATLKYHLHLTDAELQLFADSAVRFDDRDDADFSQRLAAIREADHAQHPDSHGVLSESARKANRAVIREREQVLVQNVDDLRAHFAPKRVKEIDAEVVNLYANSLTVPPSAPRASTPCAMPDDSPAKASASVH
jgi:hypothetical protein